MTPCRYVLFTQKARRHLPEYRNLSAQQVAIEGETFMHLAVSGTRVLHLHGHKEVVIQSALQS
jgi:hypothetical protein